MQRIAVVDNQKIKELDKKKHVQSLCPVNRSGTECITIESDNALAIDEVTCIGCGICVKAAPEAIKIVNLPEILDTTPIHRYGDNAFALFSIPQPSFGSVVGILGVNGIGKSSAISVVAGLLKPNFGEFGTEADYDKIIQHFKGTELQAYFERVKQSDIVVSFKPQHVELIPKTQKGKVKDLLNNVDEQNKFDDIVEALELSHFLDNDIEKLSGGELQRVAIAACVLRKANLYIFDEPSSYLDISQRIKVSKFIRSLCNDETAVIVVEHDLIIFDYLSDVAQIMYGSEDVYGSLSGVKPTKNAINVYLSGYLKEENVRFREKHIAFEGRKVFVEKDGDELISWDTIEKKLGNFSLSAKDGVIKQGDVIGVLGENGIGKTTFVKILAGEIEPDSGKLKDTVKVGYKPQYIESSDDIVQVYLQDAISKYMNQLITPLHIKPLYLKQLNELSGGELQRVAIAKALSEDAELYLLDEPSAYLDVEARLNISKVIRDFMEITGRAAIIVDHDLLFLDYLSDKLFVFDGTPASEGRAEGPFSLKDGMNMFLERLQITLRRDKESGMPRVNKDASTLDREAKESGDYYG